MDEQLTDDERRLITGYLDEGQHDASATRDAIGALLAAFDAQAVTLEAVQQSFLRADKKRRQHQATARAQAATLERVRVVTEDVCIVEDELRRYIMSFLAALGPAPAQPGCEAPAQAHPMAGTEINQYDGPEVAPASRQVTTHRLIQAARGVGYWWREQDGIGKDDLDALGECVSAYEAAHELAHTEDVQLGKPLRPGNVCPKCGISDVDRRQITRVDEAQAYQAEALLRAEAAETRAAECDALLAQATLARMHAQKQSRWLLTRLLAIRKSVAQLDDGEAKNLAQYAACVYGISNLLIDDARELDAIATNLEPKETTPHETDPPKARRE